MPIGLKALLGLGLKFCPTPRPVKSTVYKEALLPLFRSIRLALQFKEESGSYHKLTYVSNPAYHPPLAHSYIEGFMNRVLKTATKATFPIRPTQYNLSRRMRALLSKLKNQKTLKVLQTDKNLGPAIMTCTQYQQFCLDHLGQADTYRPVNEIPLTEIRKKVADYYQILCRVSPSAKKDSRIIVHGLETTTPSYFHALPKIHKTPMGCRPIVSSINAPTTGLSKWLTYLLTPIAVEIQSYVRDSDTLQSEITQLSVENTDVLYTFDVENMYTSIPIEAALKAVHWFLNRMQHPLTHIILTGLQIVLEYNYFTFGTSNWKQLRGLAMGTPVAPTIATLYLGYFEETQIIPSCRQSLRLYKRYLDDIILIWRPHPTNPYEFQRFRAILRKTPGLTWTFKEHADNAPFLDLYIFSAYATRTHQKAMNLYLYPTFNSAHAPAVKNGMIYGLLKKYKRQNSETKDFHALCKLLFQRLLVRGYRSNSLRPLCQNALERLTLKPIIETPQPLRRPPRPVFYKIPYDPNGPSRSEIRTTLALNDLSNMLLETENIKIIICYQKPNNLGNTLMRNKTPAEQPSNLATTTHVVVQDLGVE